MSNVPAKLLFEKRRQRTAKGLTSCGGVVVSQHLFQTTFFGCNLLHPLPPNRIHFWNMRRLTTAKHTHIFTSSESFPEVVHQLADATSLTEVFPKCRQLPLHMRDNHFPISACHSNPNPSAPFISKNLCQSVPNPIKCVLEIPPPLNHPSPLF